MSKPVILTGIRANNDLHIGNYFGALLPIVDMAKHRSGEYQVNLFVPDLHSFTTPIDHSKLYEQTMHNLKIFVAAGLPLDNPDIHIYRQSYVPAHSELTWILDCFTAVGDLSRMTQFREKSGRKLGVSYSVPDMHLATNKYKSGKLTIEEAFASLQAYEKALAASSGFHAHQNMANNQSTVGLFNYPVLMAADILLYDAIYVPVGDDQTQHLEFTRDIAERMNARFGNLFVVPKPVKEQHAFFGKDQGLRIKDLSDPTKKMSKSDESGKGIIFMGDDPEVAAKKIMGATTDSVGAIRLNPEKQPGISNLLQILALLRQKPLDDVVHEYQGETSYGKLKTAVADEVKTFLTDFQNKLARVNEVALQSKLEQSEAAMCVSAGKTLEKVQRAVGLRPSA